MPAPPMMAGQEASAEPQETQTPPAETPEPTSVFIPKEALGGRDCKPGDTLTLTVKDVDPETGEVEASAERTTEKPKASGLNEAIDEMPEGED